MERQTGSAKFVFPLLVCSKVSREGGREERCTCPKSSCLPAGTGDRLGEVVGLDLPGEAQATCRSIWEGEGGTVNEAADGAKPLLEDEEEVEGEG